MTNCANLARVFGLAALFASACGSTRTTAADADPFIVDGSGGIFDTTRYMASCTAYNKVCTPQDGSSCGQCQYRIHFDRSHCSPAHPCDNLFLLWAAMGCEGDQIAGAFDALLAAHPGYVTACVQPLYPGEKLPTTLGAPERDVAVMTELFTALRDDPEAGAWTGKNLLMGGCSAGATRYPVLAARYPDDARWLGTAKTAVCFSDGVVSVSYQDQYIGEAIGTGGMSCAGRHGRVATGYTVGTATATHSCTNSPEGQCACDPDHAFKRFSGDCGDGDCSTFDTIVEPTQSGFQLASGVTTENFAVTHWKLVSEGDGFRTTAKRCDADVVPEAPLRALCDAIDADSARSCTFQAFPDAPHCSQFGKNLSSICVDWFETL